MLTELLGKLFEELEAEELWGGVLLELDCSGVGLCSGIAVLAVELSGIEVEASSEDELSAEDDCALSDDELSIAEDD